MQLVGNGVVFLGFAIATLINLQATAHFYGFEPIGIGGHNEFRAVYMGFWLGLTILFFTSVKYYHLAILGDMALILTGMQSLGRIYSILVDGIPPTQFLVFTVAEFLTAAIGLAIRPQPDTQAKTEAEPALA
ncbi:MAG TPA: DUF4345 family protein [Longimicrobiaceae bacterium]|nr:DUF4345 family protein [Longimicrobiaceae bacterium]